MQASPVKQSLTDIARVFLPPCRARVLGQGIHLFVTLLDCCLYVPASQGNGLLENKEQKWPAGQGTERDV